MKSVIVSTKLKTTNIGNQALSDELIQLSKELASDNLKFRIIGRPFGLDRYSIDQLDQLDIIASFERLAIVLSKKAKKYSKKSDHLFDGGTIQTNLLNIAGSTIRTESIRRLFRKLRKFYLSFFTFSPVYEKRLKCYHHSDFYLYSAAGEVSEEEFFFRQLLDLRIAQLLGLKVWAINQSIELPEGRYKQLCYHVYSKLDKIIVRGNTSRNELNLYAALHHIISLAPDTAFLTKVDLVAPRKEIRSIALNFTKKTYKQGLVAAFINKLITGGYKLTFVTNDPYGDSDIAKQLNTEYQISYVLETMTYRNYAKFLQSFDLVISSRLHTNELALCAGVPVLPIEGNLHKTTEVFELIQYPIKPIMYTTKNYGDDLFLGFEKLERNYDEIQLWIRKKLPEVALSARKNLEAIV